MGNVNMEADQIHVRDNNHKTWRTVADALKALEASSSSVEEDIEELYTRDSSRASKDDITNEFDAESVYHISDYVYYEGTLFKFTANHSGEWDPADVIVAQIGEDLADAAAALNYSTTEQPTGQKWIDGKDIYFKVVSLGNLPAAGEKQVNVNITGATVIRLEGYYNTGTYVSDLFNLVALNNFAYDVTNDAIVVNVSSDLSSVPAYAIIYYTKTT